MRQWSPMKKKTRKTCAECDRHETAPRWIARPMGARVNLEDKEALYQVLA